MILNDGIILKVIAGLYTVKSGNNTYECSARGNFKNKNIKLLAGDSVKFNAEEKVICELNKRKNFLIRPPVANIDNLFIVSSFNNPTPNAIYIDRLTVIADINNIKPIIVFNKCDTGDFSEWVNIYKNSGIGVIVASAKENIGIEEIKENISGKISAFTGNSGVGKSSLLNKILNLKIETGEVSKKLGRGKHTTRETSLYSYNNGYIVDTPGFSSIETERVLNCKKEDLAKHFNEFNPFLGECKFTSCSHTTEKGCAVIEAVKNGKISSSRHSSYVDFYNELKNIKEWER